MINEVGWICISFDIPVYPTLACTRSDSIARWSEGRPAGLWAKYRRKGKAKCIRVRLVADQNEQGTKGN